MTRLADILAERGPLTGAELVAAGDFTDVLELWRACHAPGFALRRTGRRYLRLDYAVDGYARLSPSIRREFLTYTLVGLPDQTAALAARYQLVTPLSGAVVLETAAQYQRFGLEQIDANSAPAIPSVPEPSTSVLVGIGVLLALRRRRAAA